MAPTECGRRLLPVVIDQFSKSENHRPYASIPTSADVKDGFLDISYGKFANAINKCARILADSLGTEPKTFAYLGPSDIRYPILLVAAMKSGHKCFFPSPRNNMEAQKFLLEATDCQAYIKSPPDFPMAHAVHNDFPLKVINIPGTIELLDDTELVEFPFQKSFEEARLDICCILHTSGSTGTPKPIFLPSGYWSVVDTLQEASARSGRLNFSDIFRDCRAFMPYPGFHIAGLLMNLPSTVFFNMTAVFAPAGPLTANVADAVLEYGNVKCSILPGSVLSEIVQNPAFYKNLVKLDAVGWAGTPIPKIIGDSIKDKVYPFNLIGSTEAGWYVPEVKNPEDWEYFKYSPFMGCEFRQDSKDTYEMVLVRDSKLDLFQGIFLTFPELNEWSTKDLYSKHPSKPDHWLYCGRLDDVIVFSNGEKLNPVTMEGIIGGHPEVSGALVVGNRRFQSALIVELKKAPKSSDEERAILTSLLPAVKKANKDTVAHGSISEALIMFALPEKPFPRTAKGSIRRKVAEDLYKDEIDVLYAKAEAFAKPQATPLGELKDTRSILKELLEQYAGLTNIDRDADFFENGMDSLHTTNLTRALLNVFPGTNITSSMIYSNPTIDQLGQALLELGLATTVIDKEDDKAERIGKLLSKYSKDLPITTREPLSKPTKMIVILTGSTGQLGSYVLHNLISNHNVDQVYCLNRSADAATKQAKLHETRGLCEIPNSRVHFLTTDFSQPHFGFANLETYKMLLRNVTHIIHNAWAVDFNLTLASFEPTHVNGVRQLIDFHARSTYGAYIYFLSTVSTVFNWSSPSKVPAAVIQDNSLPGDMGYAESKYVCEQLLHQATKELNSRVGTICRVGQIAGPVLHGAQGMWGKQEWFPTLIFASIQLGVLPDTLGPMDIVDWLPIDRVAECIVALLASSSSENAITAGRRKSSGVQALAARFESPSTSRRIVSAEVTDTDKSVSSLQSTKRDELLTVHHVTNPSTVSYSRDLLPMILDHMNKTNLNIYSVPLSEWVATLRNSNTHDATALVPFFENLANGHAQGFKVPLFSTEATDKACGGRLSKIGPIRREWVELWMKQWGH